MTRTIMGVELMGWRTGDTLHMAGADEDGIRLTAIATILKRQGWDARVVSAGGIFNLEATAKA